MLRKENEKGYTMIETIMYISILGVLGVILAGYINKVFNRYKIGRIGQQLLDLRKSILSYTAADEDYTRLSLAGMMESNSLPPDMRSGYHAFSGKINFGPVGTGDTAKTNNDKYLFYITFEGIYQPACIELLSQGQFYGDRVDLDTLIVNNNVAWRYERSFFNTQNINTVHKIQTLPNKSVTIHPNMPEIMDACSREDDNIITWIFS